MRRAFAALLVAGCAASTPHVVDLDGRVCEPLAVGDARASVLVFVTTDCPIANSYAPEIRAIAEHYRAAALRFFLVHVDPDLDVADARRHAADYGYGAFPIVFDREHALVRATGVTVTPEVAVVTRDGIAYRGRVDDQWAGFGDRRQQAKTHDLRDALDAVLAGRACPVARTQAIGCDVPVL